MVKNKSGFKNVYKLSSGKWIARVTKNGKVYSSKPVDHFDRAKEFAIELRRELKV